MRYTLELSEKQAEIIKIALEEYFRLRMNQTWDFADDICFEWFNYENHTKEDFNERIERRDMFRDELEKLLNAAQDIWQVIRHRLWKDRHGDKNDWCVDAREPMPMMDEPLPKMDVVEE